MIKKMALNQTKSKQFQLKELVAPGPDVAIVAEKFGPNLE